ncbi:hypothetical protein, partial [Isoptericola cucumis]
MTTTAPAPSSPTTKRVLLAA